MPLTSKTRGLIAVAALLCVAGIAAGLYLHRGNRPLPPAAPALPAPTPGIFTELPAAAPVIAFANVKELRHMQNTPLASVFGLAAPGPAEDHDYRNFVRDTGFDYTRDLDQVAVAFWPSNLVQAAGAIGQNRILAVADGRFDQQKIEAYALRTGRTVKQGAETIYFIPGNPPVAFKFLLPTRILIASGQDPVGLLTIAGTSSDAATMHARISRVAGAPIFAVAQTSTLPNSLYSSFKNSLYISTLADTFRVIGRAELADPNVRRQMTRQQDRFLTGLLNDATVNRDSNWVRLTFEITPAMLASPR